MDVVVAILAVVGSLTALLRAAAAFAEALGRLEKEGRQRELAV